MQGQQKVPRRPLGTKRQSVREESKTKTLLKPGPSVKDLFDLVDRYPPLPEGTLLKWTVRVINWGCVFGFARCGAQGSACLGKWRTHSSLWSNHRCLCVTQTQGSYS